MNFIAEISLIDIAVAAALLFGAIRGGIRGLSGEVAGVVSALAAFALAWWFSPVLGVWLTENSRLTERGATALTFALTAITVILAGIILSYLLRNMIRLVIAKPFDKVSGVAAGVLRIAFLTLILFCIMTMVNNEYLNRVFGEDSYTGRQIIRRLPDEWQENAEALFQEGRSTINSALQEENQNKQED